MADMNTHKVKEIQEELLRSDLEKRYLNQGKKLTMYLGEDGYALISAYADYKAHKITRKEDYISFSKFISTMAARNLHAVEELINE